MTDSALPRGRGTQTARQLAVMRELLRGWHSMRELCDALYGGAPAGSIALSPRYRTAYRDIEQLVAIGVPIEWRSVTTETGEHAEYRLRWDALRKWFSEKAPAG